ncbi:putative Inner membrane protein [Azospirillaceae bacterium]
MSSFLGPDSTNRNNPAGASSAPESPAERVIARFGGVRPMAHKLAIPAATVQEWKKNGAIPTARLNELRLAAQRHLIRLDEAELEALRRVAASETETVARTTAPLSPPPLASSLLTALPLPALLVTRSGNASSSSSSSPPGDAAGTGKKRSKRVVFDQQRRIIIAAALVAFVIIVALLSAPMWVPSSSLPGGVAVLEKRIESLENRVAQTLTDQAGTLATQAALLGRIDALERLIPTINQRIAAMPLNAPLAMMLAAGQLRATLVSSNPFQSELAAVRMLHFGDEAMRQAMDQVAGRASVGIASESWLIEKFTTLAPSIVRAGLSNADVTWLERVVGWVSLWMPRLGSPDTEGSGTRAIVARVEAWLAAGEFAKAVEQAGQLTDYAADVAGPWLVEARARVAADQLRTLLTRQMIALLPSSGTNAPPTGTKLKSNMKNEKESGGRALRAGEPKKDASTQNRQ